MNEPKELLNFMKDFKYEWMDKSGKFHDEITPDMYENYCLMTPEEVLKYKKGICVDQCEFERTWFTSKNIPCKVMNIEIEREYCKPGHAFLIYHLNNKCCWFENAWYDERGIHEYNSYDELIDDIKNKFIIQNNITTNEIDKITIIEQEQYPYHLSYEEIDEYKKNKA